MNVTIFAHYASVPKIGQYTGHYDLARGLVSRGHQVTIVASSFSHYTFRETILSPGETWRLCDYDGVRFLWVLTPPYHANDWRRMRNMIVYSWRAVWLALRYARNVDVCVGVCVHPLAGLAAWVVARFQRAQFVYEIRDLWPTVLIEMGRLRSTSMISRGLFSLERFLFRRATRIVGTWRSFDRYVAEVGADPNKVRWIPQFADLERLPSFAAAPQEPPFVVMYTGGHVNFMGLDRILEAAATLQLRHIDDVKIVFVGGGQEKSRLMSYAADLSLRNVEFRDPVPKNVLYGTMSSAHAFIICMPGLPHHRFGVSTNKLCDYLMMGRPIVYGSISTYNPVLEARAGTVVHPDDPQAIAEAIVALKRTPAEERAAMGKRGVAYGKQYHERMVMVDRWEKLLSEVCAESAAYSQ